MANLTIAQALRRIKKLKGLIAESQQRAVNAASYETTKVPPFPYKESVDAMFALQEEVVTLESKVAVANATNSIQDGQVTILLTQAVRALQEIKGRIAFLSGLKLRNETVKDRNSEWDDNEMKSITRVTETVFVSSISEQDRDVQVRGLKDRFEVLNNAVEEANHKVVV